MSHFPDLSELSSPPASFNGSSGAAHGDVDDPTADFLARERAALGDDADLITGSSYSSPQPPLSSSSFTSPPATFSGSLFDTTSSGMAMDTDPPVSDSGNAVQLGGAGPIDVDQDSFERNFPALDQTVTMTATTTSFTSVHSTPSLSGSMFSPHVGGGGEEPAFVREWRERQAAVIAERESRAADEKAKRVEQARKAIDRFYEDYNSKREKAIATNRVKQKEDSFGAEGANVWERACRMADLIAAGEQQPAKKKQQPKSARDSSRMRNLLLDLRTDPKAPGVAAK